MPVKERMNNIDNADAHRSRTIVVTDSGLGGLSVFNDIANRLDESSPWPSVNLVYFNAWPAPHRGYNHFETWEKRATVFGNSLHAMLEFKPDQILIACNTLSVIYPDTEFCLKSGTPVEGIVDHGVQMLYHSLVSDPGSIAVVLGTPATANAKSHEKGLEGLGIDNERVVNIGCTNLAGWIEREPFSHEVDRMITSFVRETVEKLGNFTGNIHVGLCCTHFGYKQALFERAFADNYSGKVNFLNPNVQMAKGVVESGGNVMAPSAIINRQVVSKAVWKPEQVNAYLRLMPDMSHATRDALQNYTLNTQLFAVD